MFRKLVLSSIAIVALSLGSFATAEAQSTPTPTSTGTCYYNGAIASCLEYPAGGFGSAATATPVKPTPAPTNSTVPSADNVTATGGTGNGQIAFTGSESRVLGYAGIGLIGFGAVALIAARRRSESELD